jgi:multidrug efflux system outer membrane protein
MCIMKPALVLLARMLAACTVKPDYVSPNVARPSNWTEHTATPAEIVRTNHELKQWWTSFNDPTLDRLVDVALTGNIDLKIAGQRLIEARAARVIAASADCPQIDAGGLASDKQASNTVLFPPVVWNRSNYPF